MFYKSIRHPRAVNLLSIQTIILSLILFFLIDPQNTYAEKSSKFTLYVTTVLPGIMLKLAAGPPFAYSDINANIPLSRFKISNNYLRRTTIELNARYYLHQLLSVVDEYSLSGAYFSRKIPIGNLFYTAGVKFVYDRIKNRFSLPIGGGVMLHTPLSKWLYLVIPLDTYLYTDGYEIESAVKIRMVINPIHLGFNVLLRGVFYSKYNFSKTAGDILFGIGVGGEG